MNTREFKYRSLLSGMKSILNRRSFILGAATGVGAMTVRSSKVVTAASAQTMSLNVIYPNHDGARFDTRYYRDKHIPLVMKVNAAIPDEHISVTTVRFEGDDIIEADMVMDATQTGELFGIPATGRKICFDIHERCRFVDGKLAERWAEVDLDDIRRQITGPFQ